MNKSILKLAFGLSLGLALLVFWRHQVNQGREKQATLFFSYVDGPLNDYALSVTRSLPVALHGAKNGYAEGAGHAERSLESLKQILVSAPSGWIRERLEFVLPWHQKLVDLHAAPPRGASQLSAWLAAEKEAREKIIYTLEDVRYNSFSKWKISQSKLLELNALIFSLKEAQEAAAH